jgi:hypothetical protein
VAAALLVVAANAALVLIADPWRLIVVLVLLAAALVWLRWLVHVGLREEAGELAVAEPRSCPNCGRITVAGSYCSECGISLRALPKRPARPQPGATGAAAGPLRAQPPRLRGTPALVTFLIALAAITALAAIVVILLAPRATPPCPDPTRPCPAAIASAAPAAQALPLDQADAGFLRFGETITDELGWQLDYDPRWWNLDEGDPSGARWFTTGLTASSARGTSVTVGISLRLEVVPVAERTPDDMLRHLVDTVGSTLEAAAERDEPGSRLLSPHIGYQPAVSRFLVGDFGTAGALTPFGAHVLAASDGRLTAGIVLYVGNPDETFPQFAGSVRTTRYVGDLLDDILKRFYWTEAGP